MFTLLVDMDGVLTKDKEFNPFPDAKDFLSFLKEKGIPFRIVSNNSTRSPELIVEKLKEKGLPVEKEEFISPVAILPEYLKKRGIKSVFVMGTEMLKEFLSFQGFEVREDYKVDAVVIGQDKSVDFNKIKTAVSAVFLNKAKIVPVNLSKIVKDNDGLYFPGAGSYAYAIKHATNYEEEIPNLGKPSREFIDLALQGLPREEVFLVSDDLYTDLIGAKELGIKTVFMTTGKYGREELEKAGFVPDYVFSSLSELREELERWLS